MTTFYRGISGSQYIYSADVPPADATSITIVYSTAAAGGVDRGTFESIFDLPNVLSSANTVSSLAIGDYATVTSESTSPFYCTYGATGIASWSQDIGVPTDFSDNLAAWWEADRGVTLSGNDVTSWTDQSSNGFVLTSSTADSPAYVTSSTGIARRSIKFDGSVTRMSAGNVLNPEATSMTWFLVVSTSTGAGTIHIAGKRNTGAAGGADAGYLLSSFSTVGNFQQFFIDTGAAIAASGVATNFFGDGFFHVITVQFDRPNGGIRNFVDGATKVVDTDAGVINYNISTSGDFAIGSTPYTASPGEFFKGEIAAIICYRELLSGSKRTRVEAYLTNKYKKDLGY